jgi:hypothetical protein
MLKGLMNYLGKKNDNIIISYKALRRLIGILGILLPIINVLGGCIFAKIPIQQSISMYYYTNMRDFLVGLMFVVSLFLITYKGYSRLDLIISTIIGIVGLGVAIFPCYNEFVTERVGIFQLYPIDSNYIHLSCAISFFILLAVNSIFLFTRTGHTKATPQKIARNIVYVVCGIVILLCVLGLILGYLLLTPEQRFDTKILLILESIALFAFGISWLVKGETLFRDKKI